MLKLLLGIAGSGKTTRMLDDIEALAKAKKASVLLVPEQFSSSAEGLVYRALGDALSGQVQVVSFRTLAERILKSCGGLTARVLNDAQRVVFVRRALDAAQGELRMFARQRRSATFCNLFAQTLAELKTAGATPQHLRQLAEEGQDEKLREIALVFDAYEAAIDGAALDPEDRLVLAAQSAGCGLLAGTHFFIDGFDGFTAPEYTLLRQVLQRCEAVTVALCCNGLDETDFGMGMFSPVRRTAQRLKSLAAQAGVPAAEPEVLPEPLRHKTAGPRAVNLLMACGQQPEAGRVLPGVWAGEAQDEWEEAKLAAAEMRRLALEGVPYSKMALVCRDVALYEQAVRRQCALYDIPLFIDTATTIEYSAPIALLRAALALVRGGLSSAAILALLKTGLCGYDEEAIAALENYVFTWQPKAAGWRAPFEKHPDGLLKTMGREAEKQLALAEGLRAELVPVLENFIRGARGKTARQLSRRLYLLMDSFDAAQKAETLAAQLEEQGDVGFAQQARRAWDLAMEMLDAMAGMLGEEKIAAADYDELLLILVRSTDFGQVPQTLECAVLTGADRMRLAQPDYCFVLGVCEGEFPAQVGYSGLLTHLDRDRLVEGGIELPGSFENRMMLEDMFFYKALCAPEKGLYISWPKRGGGQPKSMSAALGPVVEALCPPALEVPLEVAAATPAAAYDMLGGVYRENGPLAATLYAALQGQGGDVESALKLLRDVDNLGDYRVEDAAAISRLVGEDMTLSATMAERYYQCRFAYYMERVLRVQKPRKAELSSLESGVFVHYVLEKVLGEAGPAFGEMTDGQLAEAAERHARIFVEENLPEETRRTRWLVERIGRAAVRLLAFLRDAAAQSAFETDALELGIGTGEGDVPPLRVQAQDGSTVEVIGQMDRVDKLFQNGKTYLCVIDYKTGSKKLDLDELYCGLNMQMMIYLDALCENARERYPNAVPAGVLYLASDPAPESGSREKPARLYRFDGLLLDDAEMLRALDESGAYMPVRFKADGSIAASSQVASAAEFEEIRRHVRGLLGGMAAGVHGGHFAARPRVKGTARPCSWCDYRAVCRHEDGQNELPVEAPQDAFAPGGAEREEGGHG